MSLGPELLKMMSKVHQPSALVERKFRGYDIAFKTDDSGNPVVLFIGKKNSKGMITGKRYARRLLKDKDGKIIKNHWDDKGKI